MAKYPGNPTAVVRMHANGEADMNDVAVGLVFGLNPGQVAARKLYGGSPFTTATRAMRKRAVQRRKVFTRATGQEPDLIEVVRWYAAREGVGVMYRRDGQETVMIAPDGTVIDRVNEQAAAHA